jgi:hypothetical protein
MAEVLGILASSIAVGQLTEQIVRGTRNLHDFWHSVRDAPKDIELLLEELKILGDTLTELQSDPGSQDGSELRGSAVTNCLQYCKRTSDELETVIVGLQHNMDGKKSNDNGVRSRLRSRRESFRSSNSGWRKQNRCSL